MARKSLQADSSANGQLVLDALKSLKSEGKELVGPVSVARAIEAKHADKKISTTLAGYYLKRLADEGKVERVSQGERRGQYRLVKEA